MTQLNEQFGDSWSKEVREAQEFVNLNNDEIATINDEWDQISQHIEEKDIDNKKLIDTARTTLSEQQDNAVRTLLEVAKDVPYEDMVEYLSYYQDRVNTIRAKLASEALRISDSEAKLRAQRDIIVGIAPSLAKPLESAVESEAAKLKSKILKATEAELVDAEKDLAQATNLFELTGKAWHIPDLVEVNYEPAENEIVTIDRFPDEREGDSHAIAEKIRRTFESRLSDASLYLALLLSDKPGHIWTTGELGEAIYDDHDNAARNETRVSALISNYRGGRSPKMDELFGEDLVLQRGKRAKYDLKTKKRIPHTVKVVYRLVDKDTARKAQTITTLNREENTRQSYGDWEPVEFDEPETLPINNEQPSKQSNEKNTTSAIKAEDEAVIDLALSLQDEVSHEAWVDDFTEKVHAAVEKFKELNLMDSKEISWKILQKKSDSSGIATDTARKRAESRKIIKHSQSGKDATISMSQAILVYLGNSNKDIFDVARRRREAMRIVEEIVDGYFAARERE